MPVALAEPEIAESSDAANSSDEDGSLESYASEGSVGDHHEYPAMVWNASVPHETGGISTLEATMSLGTAIIGAGIMALPQLPQQGGLYICVAAALVGALVTQECGGAFFKAFMAFNKSQTRKDDRLVCFEDFGRQAMGRFGGIVVRISVIGWMLGISSSYVILMANQLINITGSDWNFRYWVVGVSPVLWGLCMLRDISAVAKLMPIAVLAALGSCGLISLAAFFAANRRESWITPEDPRLHTMWPEKGFMPVGSVVATFMGAYGVMGNITPVVNEMKSPRKFPKALKTAITVVCAGYMCVMILGYWAWGNFIQSNIVVSMSIMPANSTEAFEMPPSEWTGAKDPYLAQMLSYAVLTNLMLSYPLNMMSVFASIQGLSCAKSSLQPGQPANYGMRTAFVAVTVFIATVVDNFGIVFGLFASLCMPIMAMAIPIIFGDIIRAKIGAKRSGPVRWFFHVLILALALFTLVIGFIDSFMSLLKEMRG